MRKGCSGSGWRRPRESRLRMAYGASVAASRASNSARLGMARRLRRLHRELDGGARRPPDLDDDRERAEILEGLVEPDAAPVDVEPLLGEQPLDVEVGDGAEQPASLPRVRLDGQREAVERRGQGRRRLLLALGL